MKIKDFFTAVLYGAATCIGFELVKKGAAVAKDPYKKAQIKKAFTNFKSAFSKED